MLIGMLDRRLDDPTAIAQCLAPYASRFGFRHGDGVSRIFTAEPDRWVLKGGTAMLARIGP